MTKRETRIQIKRLQREMLEAEQANCWHEAAAIQDEIDELEDESEGNIGDDNGKP